ncbi:MAG: hypothetical protein QM751_12220 [Paludibacteraceae bacterium]
MKTNQIFSFRRFINLIKSDLLINYKKYGMQCLVMFILGYGLMYIYMPKYNQGSAFDIKDYFQFFIFSSFALGTFVGSSFPAFNTKRTKRTYLLTPASTFEKYTAQIFGRMIVTTLLFLIIFWVDAQLARFTVLHSAKESIPNIDVFSYSTLLNRLQKDEFTYRLLWFLLLSIGAFLFAVRIYFGKQGLLKAVLSLTGVLVSVSILFMIMAKIFYSEIEFFSIKTPVYNLTENLNNWEVFVIIIFAVSWLFFLAFGFFKLKEKEL